MRISEISVIPLHLLLEYAKIIFNDILTHLSHYRNRVSRIRLTMHQRSPVRNVYRRMIPKPIVAP